MTFHSRTWRCWVVLLLAIAVTGCVHQRHPVPADLVYEAQVPGMPEVREWAHQRSEAFQKSMVESISQEPPGEFTDAANGVRTYNILALSGGGPNGAYGAGLLNGWTEAGDRPRFKLVTGVSTGALISTFALLGSDYDKPLKESYTTVGLLGIIRLQSLLSLPWQDSVVDTRPLADMIRKYVTDDVIRAVAGEHAKGRRLFVATTNLDADRVVIWDMGAIASVGTSEAFDLYRDVILASSSVPVVFPPVYMKVQAKGEVYDEMHVDGGIRTTVFVRGFMADVDDAIRQAGIDRMRVRVNVFIIRNGKLLSAYDPVEPRIRAIAGRSFSSMLNAQSLGDVNRIYRAAVMQGAEFYLAAIPPDDKPTDTLNPFNRDEMTRLFTLGCEMARKGYPWMRRPPGSFADEKTSPDDGTPTRFRPRRTGDR